MKTSSSDIKQQIAEQGCITHAETEQVIAAVDDTLGAILSK